MKIVLFVLALFFAPPHGSTSSLLDARPDCRQIEALTGGVELEWLDDGNGYGYWDLPSDLKLTDRVEFAVGGVWQYTAKSQPGVRWIWWWGDYEYTTDANGQHGGNHHFCAVKVSDD